MMRLGGFKRLGILGDWENPYITYQPQMEAKQIGVFADMYNPCKFLYLTIVSFSTLFNA